MSGFEGSYMGDGARISERAIMECKICWHVYDPAIGDETRQVLAGTPFFALPEDWGCPECDADAAMFLVKDDPGSDLAAQKTYMDTKVAALVADFQEIYNGKMKDVPLVNHALQVEAIGFRAHEGRYLGVLMSPWFMNLVMLPAINEDWNDLQMGAKEQIGFPSGNYEFIHNHRELVGGYKACSLFSPMADFTSQLQAKEVAEAVMIQLFNEENIEETDRRAEIRETREGEIAAAEEAAKAAAEAEAKAAEPNIETSPTRRAFISGGIASDEATSD